MEDKICNNCTNKHINDENRLFCWKGIDTSNIVSACNDFTTEVIDNEFIFERNYQKKNLSSDNVLNYNYKKVKRFFIIMIFLQVLFFFQNLFVSQDSDVFGTILYLVLSIALFIMVYKGKRWALVIYNILNFIGLISVVGIIVLTGKMHPVNLIVLIPYLIIISYQIYFINSDEDFRKHLKAQRNE